MKVTRDPPAFRPVTIRLETQDELDKLLAIIASVARNNTHLTATVIRAAVDMEHTLTDTLNRDD